jgi:hypothetical protein
MKESKHEVNVKTYLPRITYLGICSTVRVILEVTWLYQGKVCFLQWKDDSPQDKRQIIVYTSIE